MAEGNQRRLPTATARGDLWAAVAAAPAPDWTGWPFFRSREPRYLRTRAGMDDISLQQVLEVVGDFDESGGASLALIAWELFVEEQRVARAWEQGVAEGLLRRAGRDRVGDERLWRLTAGGWAARNGAGQRS